MNENTNTERGGVGRLVRVLAGAGAAVVLASGAHGGEPELVTDRPDQTESSKVIPAGRAQAEVGVRRGESDEGTSAELFSTLLRIGVADRWELRLGHAGYIFDDPADGDRNDGWGDSELGTKVYLREESGWMPELALLAGVSLPTGDHDFSSDRVDPAFRFLFSHTLSDRFALSYNLGGEWTSELDEHGDRDRTGALIYTLSLGASLTDSIGSFVEFYGDIADGADDAHRFDCGFTFAITDTFQLDVSGGIGLGDISDERFVGAGVSMRWPE